MWGKRILMMAVASAAAGAIIRGAISGVGDLLAYGAVVGLLLAAIASVVAFLLALSARSPRGWWFFPGLFGAILGAAIGGAIGYALAPPDDPNKFIDFTGLDYIFGGAVLAAPIGALVGVMLMHAVRLRLYAHGSVKR